MSLPAEEYRCYRHTDREAYISCQRCERLICPECMREASVGFQCPSCIVEGAKTIRQPRTIAGGAISARDGVVSMTLIALNVIGFLLTLATGGTTGKMFESGAMLSTTVVTRSGEILTGVADGDYWRIVTSAFLHENVLHIAFNMYALYLFGPFVERALGISRFIAAYLTAVVMGSVFVYWLAPTNALTIGASGAVFGLFGLALMLLLRAKQDVRTLLVLLGINVFISVAGSNISWQGHLGGFVAGTILGAAFAFAPRDRKGLTQLLVLSALWIAMIAAIVTRTLDLTS
nr:rhomboid family intrarane serine protease [Aeromicrobium sp.]